MARIGAIIDRSFVPGTRAELTVKGEFLPLTQIPAAKRLFELYVDAAAATGFKTEGEFTGGCADSGFTAGVGTPTICAVGPVGGKAHSRTNSCASTAWCRAPRPARGRSCGWSRPRYDQALSGPIPTDASMRSGESAYQIKS